MTASASPAAMEAMQDLVAATLISGPAQSGRLTSHRPGSGDVSSLTMPTTSAPPRRAVSVRRSRSGLRPDWETVVAAVVNFALAQPLVDQAEADGPDDRADQGADAAGGGEAWG